MSQRLDHHSALATGGRHVARRGALEHDFLLAECDPARGTIRQKDDPRGDFLRQTENTCGVGACRLQPARIARRQCLGDGVGGGRDAAEGGMVDGVIVQPASELADDALTGEPGQRHAHGAWISQRRKVPGREYPTPPMSIDNRTGFWLNDLC